MSDGPYPGLRPFRRDETDIFFGRESQVDELLERLDRGRFLAVLGPSGCGKSSLVLTGLLPALEAGFLAEGANRWLIATMRPGKSPMRALSNALVEAGLLGENTPAEEDRVGRAEWAAHLQATLERGPLGIQDALNRYPLSGGARLLLLVDQFEEVFRYQREASRDEADRFVNLILESAGIVDWPVYVVITMRSDFLGDCARFRGLPEAINKALFLTPRLTRSQLRDVIEAPAAMFGADLAPALTNRLLNDMTGGQDQLPILQHLLQRMFTLAQARQGDSVAAGDAVSDAAIELTLDDCRLVGGMRGALSRHADEAFESLENPQDKAIARQMFTLLTERREDWRDIRRPCRLLEVAEVCQVPHQRIAQVAEAFRGPDRSFLMPSRRDQPALLADSFLDISHESLIRQWKRLAEWVQHERQAANRYQRLRQTALLWAQGNANLLRTPELDTALLWRDRQAPTAAWAERYGGDFDLVMRFLDESVKHQKAEIARDKKIRARNLALLFGLLVVLPLTSLAVWGWWAESEARAKAELAESQADQERLTAQAGAVPRFDLALLLGAAATESGEALATRTLVALLDRYREFESFIFSHKARVTAVAFSPDGQRFATGDRDGVIFVWDAETGGLVAGPFEAHTDAVTAIGFDPDGQYLVSAAYDRRVLLWNIDNGGAAASSESEVLPSNEDSVLSLVFVLGGSLRGAFLTGTEDGRVDLWTGSPQAGWSRRALLDRTQQIKTVATSPDGMKFAAAGDAGVIYVWDASDLSTLHELKVGGSMKAHDGTIESIAFSPDGKQIVSGGRDRGISVWDLSTRERVAQITDIDQPHHWVLSVAFRSPDRILSGSADTKLTEWAVRGEHLIRARQFGLHPDWVRSVAVSPDGLRAVSIGGVKGETDQDLGLVVRWDFSGRSRLADALHDIDSELWSIAVNTTPTGKQILALGTERGIVRLFELQAPSVPIKQLDLSMGSGGVVDLNFAPDGSQLAIGLRNGEIWLWNPEPNDSREPEFFTKAGESRLASVRFSPDGALLAAAWADGVVQLWDVVARTQVGHGNLDDAATGWGDTLAFSPDGTRLAWAAAESKDGDRDDKTFVIKVQNIDEPDDSTGRKPIMRLEGLHTGAVYGIAFSPDGQKLASVGDDYQLVVTDLGAPNPEQSAFRPEVFHTNRINTVAFHPDGELIATGGRDGRIVIWSMNQRDAIAELTEHGATRSRPMYVNRVLFPDGDPVLLSSGDDGRVLKWQVSERHWRDRARELAGRDLTQKEACEYLDDALLAGTVCGP